MTTPPRPGDTGAYRDVRRRRGGAWLWWLLGLLLLAIVIAVIAILIATHHHNHKGAAPASAGSTSSISTPPTALASPSQTPTAATPTAEALVGGGGAAAKPATGAEAAAGVVGTVLFAQGSAALDADAEQVITTAAARLTAEHPTAVTVGGYTDNTATAATNQPLSAQRADTVAARLRTLLGPTVTVRAVDHAESDPVASNSTPAGQAQNRRAVISTTS